MNAVTGRGEKTEPKRCPMRSPRGICEIGAPRKHKAVLVFHEVAPGKKVAHIGPDAEAENRDAITRMRRDARRAIIAEGGSPKRSTQIIFDKENAGQCDRAFFAASLYEQLAKTENCLRILLKCPAEDARWQGLKLAAEMDHSRFFWERLRLVEMENSIKAGEGTSKGGKKTQESKQLATEFKVKQVRAIFGGKVFALGEKKAAMDEAKAKTGLRRSQIYALKKKMVR